LVCPTGDPAPSQSILSRINAPTTGPLSGGVTAAPAIHPNGVISIDATASFFGDRTTPVTDAVQPGRRITTLRHHELRMSVRTALISLPARR
jgi:hypothetical protein